MEEIIFTKMHGIGNDYIYINCLSSTPLDIPQLSIEMSRPHFGVGSDGIILILPSEVADFKMRIFNADGSEARMCGNGSRCVGKYVWDKGLAHSTVVSLETLSGIKTLHLHLGPDGLVESVTVDMGAPAFTADVLPEGEMIDAEVETSVGPVRLTAVSMGNPHGVVFVETMDSVDVHALGRELELHPMWPDRANIEFVTIDALGRLTMRVWERGSGETMACGTGACATAAAAFRLGHAKEKATIHLLGGDLEITLNPSDGHLLMTGPAATVFEGRYYRKS